MNNTVDPKTLRFILKLIKPHINGSFDNYHKNQTAYIVGHLKEPDHVFQIVIGIIFTIIYVLLWLVLYITLKELYKFIRNRYFRERRNGPILLNGIQNNQNEERI
jgi:hypothetical protein